MYFNMDVRELDERRKLRENAAAFERYEDYKAACEADGVSPLTEKQWKKEVAWSPQSTQYIVH